MSEHILTFAGKKCACTNDWICFLLYPRL